MKFQSSLSSYDAYAYLTDYMYISDPSLISVSALVGSVR